jgi:hypothetical protein
MPKVDHQKMVDNHKPENRFSTINEGPLHAALKAWYAQPGDLVETAVDGFIIDILHGDRLVEIQTRSFGAIKPKLLTLVNRHPVRLVYPIPREKWIIRLAEDGVSQLSRRKSPKTGRIESIFTELIRIPTLLAHPNFSLEILLTQEDEIRQHDPGKAWRRKGWVIQERRLIGVSERRVFETPEDLAALLPLSLPEQFTVRQVAVCAGLPAWLAQRMVYCLKGLGLILPTGKHLRAILYQKAI